jgi:hypothetical protein
LPSARRSFSCRASCRSGAGWRTSTRRPALDLAYTAGVLAFSGALVLAGKYSPFLYFRF